MSSVTEASDPIFDASYPIPQKYALMKLKQIAGY